MKSQSKDLPRLDQQHSQQHSQQQQPRWKLQQQQEDLLPRWRQPVLPVEEELWSEEESLEEPFPAAVDEAAWREQPLPRWKQLQISQQEQRSQQKGHSQQVARVVQRQPADVSIRKAGGSSLPPVTTLPGSVTT